VTFARFLLEIRHRVALLPEHGRRPAALERIARDILTEMPEGSQNAQVQRILAAFLGLGQGDEFNAELLEELTPEMVLRLDMIAAELLELGRTEEAVRALRSTLLRVVK
jgi:hypothetical protein